MKVAIVYDRVNKWGGAERVLLALNKIFPDAPLYTSVYSESTAKWADKFVKVNPSFLQRIPFLQTRHEILGTFMPWVFESHKFDGYDVVISVTSEAAKGIITSGETRHISYVLTPTRYLWSGYDDYFRNKFLKVLAQPVVSYLRRWDKMAASRPDAIVAVSTEVQSRIKKYYGRESTVVYPPLTLEGDKLSDSPGSYFLVVSRLVPYKRVDLAVEVFNELGLPLYIVGIGKDLAKLKSKADTNIRFLGGLTDKKLAQYYKKAKALVMPQYEDFGLVSIEAQSFGVPVIAYKAGGALDTVEDGVTGIFFERQDNVSLLEAIGTFNTKTFDRRAIMNYSKRFSMKNFEKSFLELVKNV